MSRFNIHTVNAKFRSKACLQCECTWDDADLLAVSILVYSVVIATARYDVRAEKLTECGDKLKELIRAIDLEIDENKTIQDSKLRIFQDRYSDIATDTENHISSDYKFAMLEMTRDYKITGLKRLQVWLFALLQTSIPLALPAVLLLFEVAFITDMVGATNVFTTYLNGVDIINKPIH
ncbi:SLATT domain-containing protein [Aeromonas veronii]